MGQSLENEMRARARERLGRIISPQLSPRNTDQCKSKGPSFGFDPSRVYSYKLTVHGQNARSTPADFDT